MTLQQDIEYVDVRQGHEPNSFYEKWVDQSSAKVASPELVAVDALRRLYPGYSLVVSEDYRLTNLLALPGVTILAPDSTEAGSSPISNVVFSPAPERIAGKLTGSLVDNVIFGSYKLTWNKSDFVVHIARYHVGNFIKSTYFVLHDGPEQRARDLLLAVALYAEQTHNDIWVFNLGNWSKNKQLWLQINDASWDDVIMKEASKKALQKDIYGFFKSEMTYKKFSIPWKRGLIMYGPPGNGKTISIKAIAKTCAERGYSPLYVKSFQSFQGEEAAMQQVFLKARQLAPCVLILEDLDSLINDKNRSFFLNQLDGLEGNDGLLVIASTNHVDRLDSGLSNRPSRFDRKYLFDDPDYQERVLYAKYWQGKLKNNHEISFPEPLVQDVAELTQGFSFAYLKEAFVATLVRITNADDDERLAFSVVLKNQIMTLRKELGKQTPIRMVPYPPIPRAQPEQKLGERISLVKQPSQEDTFTQRPRPRQLPLPTDISSTEFDFADDSFLSPMTQSVCNPPANVHRSRASGRICGTGSTALSARTLPQGCIFPAPLSAYPHVMPGSLPSPDPDRLQDPVYAARNGAPLASTSTSNLDIGRRNPFSLDNPPLIKIYDDEHVEASSASSDHDVWPPA